MLERRSDVGLSCCVSRVSSTRRINLPQLTNRLFTPMSVQNNYPSNIKLKQSDTMQLTQLNRHIIVNTYILFHSVRIDLPSLTYPIYLYLSNPKWGTADAEIKYPLIRVAKCSFFLLSEPVVVRICYSFACCACRQGYSLPS